MSSFSDEGLVVDRFNEIKEKLVTELKGAYGDDIKTDADSALGQILEIFSKSVAEINEIIEEVSDSQDPQKSGGTSLSDLVKLNGIERNPAVNSSVQLIVTTNAAGSTIPAGSLVSKQNGESVFSTDSTVVLPPATFSTVDIELTATGACTVPAGTRIAKTDESSVFLTDSEVVFVGAGTTEVACTAQIIGSGISADAATLTNILDPVVNLDSATNILAAAIGVDSDSVNATATEEGITEGSAGLLTKIINPVFGWERVTNPNDAIVGEDREKDPELRNRREIAASVASPATSSAIYTALAEIDGVANLIVFVNNTDATLKTVPPQHLWVVLQGGTETVIAETLFETVSAGIGYYNSGSASSVDESYNDPITGRTYVIKFERPEQKDVYTTIDITADRALFPATGEEDIKQAIVDYAVANYTIGVNVIYSRLYTPINSVVGHQVDDLAIDFTPSPTGTSNLEIEINEIADFDTANIIVNITYTN